MTASRASRGRRSLPGSADFSGCLVRASDAFLASGRVTTAKIALSLATGLLWASDRADRAAFPKIRA